jgi:hypothetical protein
MKIIKSTRHQKIIGDFGESLICNWLSRSGFEVALVDHTGLDIIAHNPKTNKRLGITVKSRTRVGGKEEECVILFSYRKEEDDRHKLLDACKVFGCEPWIAVYVETSDYGDVFITSLKNYDLKYRGKSDKSADRWYMLKRYKEKYLSDREVKHIRIDFRFENWNWS